MHTFFFLNKTRQHAQSGGQGEHRLSLHVILVAGFSGKVVMACNGVIKKKIFIYFPQADFMGFEELILYHSGLECHTASIPEKYSGTCSHTELATLTYIPKKKTK